MRLCVSPPPFSQGNEREMPPTAVVKAEHTYQIWFRVHVAISPEHTHSRDHPHRALSSVPHVRLQTSSLPCLARKNASRRLLFLSTMRASVVYLFSIGQGFVTLISWPSKHPSSLCPTSDASVANTINAAFLFRAGDKALVTPQGRCGKSTCVAPEVFYDQVSQSVSQSSGRKFRVVP